MSSLLWLAAAVAYGPPAPVTAKEAIDNADRYYQVGERRRVPCPESTEDNIVVCSDIVDPGTQQVDRVESEGPGAVPRAPDLEPKYAPGNIVNVKGCFIPPCPRPMPILIDLKAIPEAPPGSDADRIAKGEIPGP